VSGALLNTRRLADGAVIVEVRGELDVSSSADLHTALIDTVTNVRPIRIVVDMMHVTFLDSTGIGALAAGQNAARSVGVSFAVGNPAPFVRRQLQLMGLSDAFGLST
jgi:anti-sigma B factor antagonist